MLTTTPQDLIARLRELAEVLSYANTNSNAPYSRWCAEAAAYIERGLAVTAEIGLMADACPDDMPDNAMARTDLGYFRAIRDWRNGIIKTNQGPDNG